MIRVHAGFSKKLPGPEGQFSSEGVSLSVEVEVPDGVLADERKFTETVRSLFARARNEVEQQAKMPGSAVSQNGAHGNGASRQPSPPASKKQLDFLVSVAQRNANLTPKELLAEIGVGRFSEISRAQASELIERYRNGAP